MARQVSTLFLEDWLKNSANNIQGSETIRKSTEIAAQRIIQAWAELRDCLQKGAYNPLLHDSLKSLVDSKASLYVAEPQAKLLISILSSRNISLPRDLHPLILRLLYIWVRKSSKPSLVLIESTIDVIDRLFGERFDPKQSISLFGEVVVLIGAFCFVHSLSETIKTVCYNLLCKMLEEQYKLVGSVGELFPNVLAGIGYALSYSSEVYFTRLLNFLFGTWPTLEGPLDIFHALVILHLIEWVVFRFISFSASEKIEIFNSEVIENPDPIYTTCGILMATGGAIRASNRPLKPGERLNVVSKLRISSENRMEFIASNLTSKIMPFSNHSIEDSEVRFLVHCLSLAASRSGGLNSTRGNLLLSLGLALMIEVFPLRSFYSKILDSPMSDYPSLTPNFVKKHQECVLFKEAGAITGVFCNLYASSKNEDKSKVEDLVWSFCHEIYYGHRRVGLLLKGISDQLLNDIEKIGESVFLMVVVFALAVTKCRLSSRFSREVQIDCSVKILILFSCMEYFRRIRLPEYMEAIRSAVSCVQENDIACVSFVESLPSYVDLTNPDGKSNEEGVWLEGKYCPRKLFSFWI